MTGWTRQMARMVTIRIVVLFFFGLCCRIIYAEQLHLPMFNDITITNGLENGFDNYSLLRGADHAGMPLPMPLFYEQDPELLESISAVFSALSYARCNLSDDIDYENMSLSIPPDLSSLTKSKPSYLVEGINLTNSFIRTFTFAVAPSFSTNSLRCTLVSFFSSKSFSPKEHILSLYVNDVTGGVGLSIQQCSGYMRFLSGVRVQYPFLSKDERQKQIEFSSRFNRRRFISLDRLSKQSAVSTETNNAEHADSEVFVDAEEL